MFRFGNPDALWLLLLVPVLMLVLVWARYRRSCRIARLGNASSVRSLMPYVSAARYWLRGVLFLLALASLVLGLARPQFGEKQEKQQRRGAEIMFVLDVSQSMMAEDVKPNRLARAKLEIAKMLNRLREDRIGLVLFAGRSFVQLPITNDYASAQMFLGQVTCDMISEQGTALGGAIDLAAKSFSPMENVGKAIVVISDGENHEDDPIAAAQEAEKAGIRVFTVGIGSPDGAPIPDATQGLKKDGNGNIVLTRLDEKTLSQVALATGGIYVRANAGGLEPIVDAIDEMEKADFDQVIFSSYNEQYHLFLLLSLFLLTLATVVLERRNSWFNIDKLFGSIRRG